MPPVRQSNHKKTGIVFAGLIVLGGVYFAFNPAGGYFPPCLFYRLTGFQCPGCGTQRALHCLLHLNIGQAFCYNPLLIPALLLISLLLYLNYFGGRQRFPKLYRILSGTRFIFSVFLVIMLYWALRNLF
jgi:hypothetical protein